MSHDVGPGTPTSVGCIACRRVATLIRAPPRRTGRRRSRRPSHVHDDAAPQHQPEAEHQVLDRCVEQAAVAEDRDPPAADDRVGGVAHDAAAGEPAVGEELEEHDDRVGGPPVAGRGQPGADDPAVQHDGQRHAEEGDGGVGHVQLTSRPRGTAEPRVVRRAGPRGRPRASAPTTSGMTTKKPISSSGRPATRHGSVWSASNHQCPTCVAQRSHSRNGVPARPMVRSRRPGCLQHLQPEGGHQRQRPGEAERQHGDVRPVGKAHRALMPAPAGWSGRR